MNTPSVWQPISADMEIQFSLATKDPGGAPTTGIVHKSTTISSFTANNNIKNSTLGGDDPWDVNKYFNIWICNLGSGLLGYATFPPITNTFGVVVKYCTIGGAGSCPPYDLNRTMTHEISHCFTLRHIWGDANCGNDQVDDTPIQQTPNFGCPTFPKVTCSNGPNGDMFMNYLDYTDDACMNIFTRDQKTRAQSAITTYLMSLVDTCSTTFTLVKDTTNPLLWYAYPAMTGTPPFSYLWDFGDGNTSTLSAPTHTYATVGNYLICLTITDAAGCTSTSCDSTYKIVSPGSIQYLVVVNPMTGIEENTLSVTSVFPNPSKDMIEVSFSDFVKGTLSMTDITGREVYSEKINANNVRVNVSALPVGYYTLSVVSETKTMREKIMIAR